MQLQIALFAVILVLLIMIITNTVLHARYLGCYMQGLWAADEKFCNDSDIDGMFLYIGEGYGCHDAYMIMHSNNAVILEKKISINARSYMPYLLHNSVVERCIHLTDLDASSSSNPSNSSGIPEELDESEDNMHLSKIMPLQMQMILDTTNGSMIWQHDDTVYAKFYKDNAASDV